MLTKGLNWPEKQRRGSTSMAGGGARTELGKKLLQRSSWLLDSMDRLRVVL
jgi:hypothetical protein